MCVFASYTAALNKMEASIKKGIPGVNLVYKAAIPGSSPDQ